MRFGRSAFSAHALISGIGVTGKGSLRIYAMRIGGTSVETIFALVNVQEDTPFALACIIVVTIADTFESGVRLA